MGNKLAVLREECKQPFLFTGHRTCIFEQYQPSSSTVILPIPIWGAVPRALLGGEPDLPAWMAMPTQTPSSFQMERSFSLCNVSFLFFTLGRSASPGRETRKATAWVRASVAIYIAEKFSSTPAVGGTQRARVPLRARGNALGLVLRGRRRAR